MACISETSYFMGHFVLTSV